MIFKLSKSEREELETIAARLREQAEKVSAKITEMNEMMATAREAVEAEIEAYNAIVAEATEFAEGIASQAGRTNAPQDIQTARQAAGALHAMRTADRYTRQDMERIDSFLSVLNAQSPEEAARKLALRRAFHQSAGLYRLPGADRR